MQTKTGFRYIVDAEKELDKFAKGILALVNLKCSRKGTIVNVGTIEGTWTVEVISLVEIDGYLEDYLGGTITLKEEVAVVTVESDDLPKSLQSQVNKYIDDEVEYFLTIEQM